MTPIVSYSIDAVTCSSSMQVMIIYIPMPGHVQRMGFVLVQVLNDTKGVMERWQLQPDMREIHSRLSMADWVSARRNKRPSYRWQVMGLIVWCLNVAEILRKKCRLFFTLYTWCFYTGSCATTKNCPVATKLRQTYRFKSRPKMLLMDLTLVMTLTLDFQGQIRIWLYFRTKWSDYHKTTKNGHIDWTLGFNCSY